METKELMTPEGFQMFVMEHERNKLKEQIKAAKRRQKVELQNFLVSYTVERTRLEILAMFGIVKLDN